MAPGTDIVAVRVPVGQDTIDADVCVPAQPIGLVIFAHGSGSSRHSPRNKQVAEALQAHGLATLLADLLTAREEVVDRVSAEFRFDIGLLGGRLVSLIDWVRDQTWLRALPIGLFGASTGAAAALVAAAERPRDVAAVVSRGGRPDLAGTALGRVTAPTLLLVGGLDTDVIRLNRDAESKMRANVRVTIVEGATHLFEEPGTLDQVAADAGAWFERWLRTENSRPGSPDSPRRGQRSGGLRRPGE